MCGLKEYVALDKNLFCYNEQLLLMYGIAYIRRAVFFVCKYCNYFYDIIVGFRALSYKA